MPKKAIIKLAGGTYNNLRSLMGSIDQLQDREIVLTTDTHELFVGNPANPKGYELLGGVIFCDKSALINTYEPIKERMLWDDEAKTLYCGDGSTWVSTSIPISTSGGLEKDPINAKLKVKVDSNFLEVDGTNGVTFANTINLGTF